MHMGMEHWWNDTDRGKTKVKTCPRATSPTRNVAWVGLDSNAGLDCEMGGELTATAFRRDVF